MADVSARPDDQEIGFRRFLSALVTDWRTLLWAVGVALVLALFLILLSRPVYKATAKVLIDTRQQSIMASEELVKSLTFDTSAIDTQVELLTSGNVARRALAALSAKSPEDGSKRTEFTDREIRDFLSKLTVTRKGLTYLLDVIFSAPDPLEAAKGANTIVKSYIDEAAEADMNTAQKANAWLQDRIKTLEPEVFKLEKQILDYKAVNGLLTLGEQTVDERNLIDYMGQLGLARAALAEAEAKRELDQSKSTVSLQSQDAYMVARTKVALMERGLEALRDEVVKRREKGLELREMDRELTAVKGLYESLLKRQREIEAQESRGTVYARMVQEALPPDWPSWPPKALVLLAAIVIGLVVGVLLVAAKLTTAARGITVPSFRDVFEAVIRDVRSARRNA